jgi:hypothetical protein
VVLPHHRVEGRLRRRTLVTLFAAQSLRPSNQFLEGVTLRRGRTDAHLGACRTEQLARALCTQPPSRHHTRNLAGLQFVAGRLLRGPRFTVDHQRIQTARGLFRVSGEMLKRRLTVPMGPYAPLGPNGATLYIAARGSRRNVVAAQNPSSRKPSRSQGFRAHCNFATLPLLHSRLRFPYYCRSFLRCIHHQCRLI